MCFLFYFLDKQINTYVSNIINKDFNKLFFFVYLQIYEKLKYFTLNVLWALKQYLLYEFHKK